MKRKILHILVLPKLAGGQRISLEIFKGLSNDEYDKWVLFSDFVDTGDKSFCQQAFESAGVKVIYSSLLKREINFSDFGAILEIYKLCKKEKFDIVHTHSTKPGIIGRIAATFAGTPLVIHTVHGLSFHKFIKFPKWQFYWLCEMVASVFCDKIVMVNKFYGKYFRWCKQKVSTIYNSIDYSALKEDLDFVVDNNRVLFVGRLDEAKDPLTFIKAAKIVVDKYPKTEFTLVGDGEKYDECDEFINNNNLSDNVILAGWQNDVSKYYLSHNIFAMSSIYESFGLIFLEAAYYGLPVVATNVEGIPEVVLDNETGLLSNPEDYNTMAINIIKLIENPELAVKFGDNAKNRAETVFALNRMIDSYKHLYETSMISKRHQRI